MTTENLENVSEDSENLNPKKEKTENLENTQDKTKEIIEKEVEEMEESPEEEELEELELPHLDKENPSQKELLAFLKEVKSVCIKSNTVKIYKSLEETIAEPSLIFEKNLNMEREKALEKFKSENEGSAEGFEYHPEEIVGEISHLLAELRKLRSTFFKNLEENKSKVIEQKNQLLKELRILVEQEENVTPAKINETFKDFKKIQEAWKSLGNIPGAMNQELWKNYHALVDQFYSNRSIYFELLELDRKKNQHFKESIAYQLEEIAAKIQKESEDQFIKLIKEAEILFDEYKNIGPATKETNELLWNRVKKALDVIFDQKRQIFESRKKLIKENLKIKEGLASLMAEKAKFDSDSINDWNRETKGIVDLQTQWEKVPGGLPKEEGKKVSNEFWSSLKQFYKNKSKFFAKLDSQRKENAEKKKALISQVKEIIENKVFDAETTKGVIDLQKQWKEIGHVPEKLKQSLFNEFKKACDQFFENRRASGDGKGAEFFQNLKIKESLIEELKAIQKNPTLLGKLSEIKAKWDETGFVPKRNLKKVMDDFRFHWNKAIDLANTLPAEKLAEFGIALNSVEDTSNQGGGDQRKKIQNLENEIATLKNNLEFFSSSKTADKLIKEVEQKIEMAEKELEKLIAENNK